MHVNFTHKCDAPSHPTSSVFIFIQLLPSLFLILVTSKVSISAHYSRNTAPGMSSEESHVQCWALEQLSFKKEIS